MTTSTLPHLGEKPEPLPGEREHIAAHMGSLRCPACDWTIIAGSEMGAGLLFSLHWHDEQRAEREVRTVELPSIEDIRDQLDEAITELQSQHYDQADAILVRLFNELREQ